MCYHCLHFTDGKLMSRGLVTCDYVHCWNQMIESRVKLGNPIPGLVSNSSGKGCEFRVRIILFMVAFLIWDVSPFTLTSCGLYIFSSLANWSVLVQSLRMPTQRLCFKEPGRKMLEVGFINCSQITGLLTKK